MQLSKKLNTFCGFFSLFLKCASSFKHFEKKITLIAYLFLKLRTVKDLVRKMFIQFQSTIGQGTCQSVSKTYQISMAALTSNFLVILSGKCLENIFVSHILTLRSLC